MEEKKKKYYTEEGFIIGHQIREIRHKVGMSQTDLSEAYSKVTPEGKPLRIGTIDSIERGRYNLSVRTLKYIIAALGYEMKFVPQQNDVTSEDE